MEKLKKISAIIVDDDVMMREMLKLILRSDGYPILGEATNGQDAINMCEKLKPELVLLDINMPKMDGLQALEEIRKICPDVMVLMVSADATMDRVREAIKKGAAGFVVKPLKAANVLDRITVCIAEKHKASLARKNV